MEGTQTEFQWAQWNLTDLRNSHGISMAKLAALIGVTPATVWHWEQRPASELRPKQLKQLEQVFTLGEVDSLIHPEKYFDEQGNQIKPFDEPAPVQEPEPEPEPAQETEAEQAEDEPWWDMGDVPTALTGKELSELLNDLTAAFLMLDDKGKQQLVQLAGFMYHSQHGMRLPSLSASHKVDYAQIFAWKEKK